MGRTEGVWVARALHISWVWKNCLVPVQKNPLYTTSYPHWHKDSPLGLWPMGELHWGRDTPRGISAMENPCQGSENAQNRSHKFLLVGNKWKKIIWLKSLLHTAWLRFCLSCSPMMGHFEMADDSIVYVIRMISLEKLQAITYLSSVLASTFIGEHMHKYKYFYKRHLKFLFCWGVFRFWIQTLQE